MHSLHVIANLYLSQHECGVTTIELTPKEEEAVLFVASERQRLLTKKASTEDVEIGDEGEAEELEWSDDALMALVKRH